MIFYPLRFLLFCLAYSIDQKGHPTLFLKTILDNFKAWILSINLYFIKLTILLVHPKYIQDRNHLLIKVFIFFRSKETNCFNFFDYLNSISPPLESLTYAYSVFMEFESYKNQK